MDRELLGNIVDSETSSLFQVMLPLIISYFAEVNIVTSKKLYVAYEEGYFFPQNSTANPQPRNFGEIHDGRFGECLHLSNVILCNCS